MANTCGVRTVKRSLQLSKLSSLLHYGLKFTTRNAPLALNGDDPTQFFTVPYISTDYHQAEFVVPIYHMHRNTGPFPGTLLSAAITHTAIDGVSTRGKCPFNSGFQSGVQIFSQNRTFIRRDMYIPARAYSCRIFSCGLFCATACFIA